MVWVADTGFSWEENRRYLRRTGGHFILGEELRGNDKEARAALSRQGRYHQGKGNLEIKEVVLDNGTKRDRFMICRTPDEATRDAAVRQRLLQQLAETISGSDQLTPADCPELVGQLRKKRDLCRFLREAPKGLLRVDRAQVAWDQPIDGKYLVRGSTPP